MFLLKVPPASVLLYCMQESDLINKKYLYSRVYRPYTDFLLGRLDTIVKVLCTREGRLTDYSIDILDEVGSRDMTL